MCTGIYIILMHFTLILYKAKESNTGLFLYMWSILPFGKHILGNFTLQVNMLQVEFLSINLLIYLLLKHKVCSIACTDLKLKIHSF